jgi:hypothetical protein
MLPFKNCFFDQKKLAKKRCDNQIHFRAFLHHQILDSIVVSIVPCHGIDPGSIPGRGEIFFILLCQNTETKRKSLF